MLVGVLVCWVVQQAVALIWAAAPAAVERLHCARKFWVLQVSIHDIVHVAHPLAQFSPRRDSEWKLLRRVSLYHLHEMEGTFLAGICMREIGEEVQVELLLLRRGVIRVVRSCSVHERPSSSAKDCLVWRTRVIVVVRHPYYRGIGCSTLTQESKVEDSGMLLQPGIAAKGRRRWTR